jgi:hypothetical protein
MWNVKTNVISVIIGANRNDIKIIQKIPEPLTGKARNQGAAENSHIGHCTNTSESTDVRVQ